MIETFWLDLTTFLVGIHFISTKILNGKLHVGRTVAAGLIIFPCMALVFLSDNQFICDVFFSSATFLSYAAPMVTIKGIRKIRVVYFSLLYFAVSYTLTASCRWIAYLFTTNALVVMSLDILLQCALLAICITFSIKSVFNKAKQYIVLISIKVKILLLVSVWLSLAFTVFISAFSASSTRTLYLTFAEISAAAIIISVGIMWPFFIISNSLNSSYKAEMNRFESQMQAQIKHYEGFLQANESTRKFKHDFENVISGITGYAENGDIEGVLRLANECRQYTKNEYTEFKTGNLGVDALLVDKQAKAKEYDTQIRFNGRVPSEYVSSLDLCIIMGNALDNAIEACAGVQGEKTISVESDMANGFLSMRVSNPVKEIVPIYNGTIASTKTDKENHGIGLVSIGNCVKKYDGSIKLLCDEKLFVIEIELDLNPLL